MHEKYSLQCKVFSRIESLGGLVLLYSVSELRESCQVMLNIPIYVYHSSLYVHKLYLGIQERRMWLLAIYLGWKLRGKDLLKVN